MDKAIIIYPAKNVSGVAAVPGDKSISHRAVIFGAIADGATRVFNLLDSGDVRSTRNCLRNLGIGIGVTAGETIVRGKGKNGLRAFNGVLDCGNSGTTMRLLMGLLAGQSFPSILSGDGSLVKRPMKRAAAPLSEMGARFTLTGGNFAPLTVHGIQGTKLRGIDYDLKVASAQIKTSLLLAGLYAGGRTSVRGGIGSRDHTERMLPFFGARLGLAPDEISILGTETLRGCEFHVPGDPSSAAFWLAAAAMLKNSEIEIKNVSLNPTRTGFMKVLERMGAHVETEVTREVPEPMGTVRLRHSPLKGARVEASEIPSLIDEIPILAVLATQAEGVTEIHGARELRVKESDRIEAVAKNLRAMGIELETFDDGLAVKGPQKLSGAKIETFLDHRIAMAFSIAGLAAEGETEILGIEPVETSYPGFYDVMKQLIKG